MSSRCLYMESVMANRKNIVDRLKAGEVLLMDGGTGSGDSAQRSGRAEGRRGQQAESLVRPLPTSTTPTWSSRSTRTISAWARTSS